MRTPKLILVLIFSIYLLGCAFEENQEIEKKLTDSVNNFHALLNQEKFEQIYLEGDDELKNKFTELQFVSHLEAIKNDVGEIKEESHVWIDDELKDGIKRILFRRTKFSSFELISTEKAIYREKFDWNLVENQAKLVSFQIEKICNKPCQLNINTK